VINPDGSIKAVIVIRKSITKGQQATRSIPTHPKLKESLEQYFRDSRELLEIKNLVGQWDRQSLDRGNILSPDSKLICPQCSSNTLTTAGKSRGKRMFKCKIAPTAFKKKLPFWKDLILRKL
jgi:hypothetical protein